MAGSSGGSSGKGKLIGNIIFFVFVVGVITYFAIGFMAPSDDPILLRQADPQGAMTVYLEHADGFTHQQSTAYDVQTTVTKADWEWLQDNHERLFADRDTFDIMGGIDPSQGMHASRLIILRALLNAGPTRKDCQIVKTSMTGDANAELIIREKEFYSDGDYDFVDYRVQLVKDGRYWKVRDYAGGRASIEGRRQPDDVVYRSRSEVEGGGEVGGGLADGFGPAAEEIVAAEAGAAAVPGAAAAGAGTEQDADELVEQARRHWEAGDAQGAYDSSLKAFEIYTRLLGPQNPKTQQTTAMGQRARAALAQQNAVSGP